MGQTRVLKRWCSVVKRSSGISSNCHHGQRHSASYTVASAKSLPSLLLLESRGAGVDASFARRARRWHR